MSTYVIVQLNYEAGAQAMHQAMRTSTFWSTINAIFDIHVQLQNTFRAARKLIICPARTQWSLVAPIIWVVQHMFYTTIWFGE